MRMRLILLFAFVLSVSFPFYLHHYIHLPSPFLVLEGEISLRAEKFGTKEGVVYISSKANFEKPVLPLASSFVPGNSSYPRIAYLTYSHLNSTTRFDELIFPALEIWHPVDEPYYIILSDMWKQQYQDLIENHANFSAYEARMHPIFVTCKEGKNPEVECCKQEKGMLYMIKHYDYDWVVYLDDDNFIRSTQMREYLTDLNTNELMVGTSGPFSRFLGTFGYLPPTETHYKCSRDKSYSYPWGQVVTYNRATLKHIHRGLQLNGLVKQCLEYDVYHDVGNAIFHWMYGLPEFWVRISDRPNEVRREYLGAHGIGRCKENRAPCPMDVINRYYNYSFYRPQRPLVYTWRNATGFRTTSTYGTYGDPSHWNTEWHTMLTADCSGPTK